MSGWREPPPDGCVVCAEAAADTASVIRAARVHEPVVTTLRIFPVCMEILQYCRTVCPELRAIIRIGTGPVASARRLFYRPNAAFPVITTAYADICGSFQG